MSSRCRVDSLGWRLISLGSSHIGRPAGWGSSTGFRDTRRSIRRECRRWSIDFSSAWSHTSGQRIDDSHCFCGLRYWGYIHIHVGLMTDQPGNATPQHAWFWASLCNSRYQYHHYHADNGRFAEKSFTDDVQKNGQRITYCRVKAHHQNGIPENSIKQPILVSCTLLVHVQIIGQNIMSLQFWDFHTFVRIDHMGTPSILESWCCFGFEPEDRPCISTLQCSCVPRCVPWWIHHSSSPTQRRNPSELGQNGRGLLWEDNIRVLWSHKDLVWSSQWWNSRQKIEARWLDTYDT